MSVKTRLCQLFGMCAEIDQISQIELVTQSLTAVDCIPLSIWDNALHEIANKYNSIGSVSLLARWPSTQKSHINGV